MKIHVCGLVLALILIPLIASAQLASVGGIVTDATAMTPLAGATVQFGEYTMVTLPAPIPGAYVFQDIATGEYEVTVSMEGYQTLTTTTTLVAGNNERNFTLEIEAQPANVGGSVMDATNFAPLLGAYIQFGDNITLSFEHPLLPGTAVYVFENISAGSYRALASLPGYQTFAEIVELLPGDNEIHLALLPGEPALTTAGGMITDASTGDPIVGAEVYFDNFQASSVLGGFYTMQDLPVGAYDFMVTAEGYNTYNEDVIVLLDPLTNNFSVSLEPEVVGDPYTITYLTFVEWDMVIPGGFGDRGQLSVEGEVVNEGETFVVPDYDVAGYQLGEGFQVIMDGVSGTAITIPEGAIDQDITVHMVIKNIDAEINFDNILAPYLEFHGIISPDPYLDGQIWSYVAYEVFDAEGNQLNLDENFNFLNDNLMVVNIPLDEDFQNMLTFLGCDNGDLETACWNGSEWLTNDMVTQYLPSDEDRQWYQYQVPCLGVDDIVGGPAGGFINDRPEPIPVTLSGHVYGENGTPLEGSRVQLDYLQTFTDLNGYYEFDNIMTGPYSRNISFHSVGYEYHVDKIYFVDADVVYDATLDEGTPGINTLTYLTFFHPYNEDDAFPPIQISYEGETVLEGETFVVPDYPLDAYQILGESFNMYMAGVSGARITVPEGAIDQDITVHLIVKNMDLEGNPYDPTTWPLEIEFIHSPDPNLEDQIFMYNEYQVFDSEGNRLNGDYHHFYFNDGSPMLFEALTDDDFWNMMDFMGYDYTDMDAAYWDRWAQAWAQDGIDAQPYEYGVSEYFTYQVEHFSEIAGGPAGGFDGGVEPGNLTVPLQENYFELVSSNLLMDVLDAATVFGSVNDMQIVYQNDGGIFIPQLMMNSIGDIDIAQGYQVFCSAASEWSVEGTLIDPSTQYSTIAGQWSWIGYPLADEINVENALGHIADQVVVVQSDAGGFWIPSVPLNSLGNMTAGTGYMIFSYEDLTFEYFPAVRTALSGDIWETPEVADAPTATGIPYAVLVRLDEVLMMQNPATISILDGQKLVGKAVVLENRELTPVTAWQGSEEYNLAGFVPGNEITVQVFNTSGEIIASRNGGIFGEGAYADITLNAGESALPVEFAVESAYPNPFNPTVNVPFSIPAHGEVSFMVYNIMGQEVFNSQSRYNAGHHNFIFDAENKNLVSGMYFLKVKYNNETSTQKIMLLK